MDERTCSWHEHTVRCYSSNRINSLNRVCLPMSGRVVSSSGRLQSCCEVSWLCNYCNYFTAVGLLSPSSPPPSEAGAASWSCSLFNVRGRPYTTGLSVLSYDKPLPWQCSVKRCKIRLHRPEPRVMRSFWKTVPVSWQSMSYFNRPTAKSLSCID